MKFLVELISFVLVFFISLLIFMPKVEAYNLLEKNLEKRNIVVSNETRKEKAFGLDLESLEIYYDRLDTAFINKVDFTTYLLFSNIDITNIRVSKAFENIMPLQIDIINIKHSILGFSKLDINANGDFGEFKGELKIFDKKIVGELTPSSKMKSKYRKLLRDFKFVDGKYKYELNF